jgi:hypothetical protein
MPSHLVDPDRLAASVLFAVVFVSHSLSPNATSADSRWTVPQMMSLLAEGNVDLDEYSERLRENEYYAIDCVGPDYRVSVPDPVRGCPAASRYFGHFPIGAPVVALPVMVAMDLTLRAFGPSLVRLEGDRFPPVVRAFITRDYLHAAALVEMVLASFLVAVATALVFLIARECLARRSAILLALLFAYGTAAWSTGSRALWQHGPEMLMLAMAVYLLVKARQRPGLAAWSGLPLALAYFIRPTGAIALVALGLYVRFWRQLPRRRSWSITWSYTTVRWRPISRTRVSWRPPLAAPVRFWRPWQVRPSARRAAYWYSRLFCSSCCRESGWPSGTAGRRRYRATWLPSCCCIGSRSPRLAIGPPAPASARDTSRT